MATAAAAAAAAAAACRRGSSSSSSIRSLFILPKPASPVLLGPCPTRRSIHHHHQQQQQQQQQQPPHSPPNSPKPPGRGELEEPPRGLKDVKFTLEGNGVAIITLER